MEHGGRILKLVPAACILCTKSSDISPPSVTLTVNIPGGLNKHKMVFEGFSTAGYLILTILTGPPRGLSKAKVDILVLNLTHQPLRKLMNLTERKKSDGKKDGPKNV